MRMYNIWKVGKLSFSLYELKSGPSYLNHSLLDFITFPLTGAWQDGGG